MLGLWFLGNMCFLSVLRGFFGKAQKDGEVAEPSGGENGYLRRLAEVYSMLPRTA